MAQPLRFSGVFRRALALSHKTYQEQIQMKFNTDFARIITLTTKHNLTKELAALIAQKTWCGIEAITLWVDVYSRELSVVMAEAEGPESKDEAREELFRLFVKLRYELCDILPATDTQQAAYKLLYPHRLSQTSTFNLLNL